MELLDSQRIRMAALRATSASSSSAAAALADSTVNDVARMTAGAALAAGRPLVLSLSCPVWVVNGTQLPVAVGIVPLAPSTGSGGTGSGADNAGSSGVQLGDATGMGTMMRVLDTEAFEAVSRPGSSVTVLGSSLELLSLPTATEQSGGAVASQWAVVLSVMGSRWSSPLPLSAAGGAAATPGSTLLDAHAAAAAQAMVVLPRYEPVLLRARCRNGSVYEVAVRLETAGRGLPLAHVLRLDPHLVISNRTGYTLQLITPEPIWRAQSSVQLRRDRGGSGSSSSADGGGSHQQHTGGAWMASGDASSTAADRRPGGVGGGVVTAAPPVRDCITVLRPGAQAVPVSWSAGCSRRMLVLALQQPSSRSGTSSCEAPAGSRDPLLDPELWCEPFRLDYPTSGTMQLLLPLARVDGAHGNGAAALAALEAAALAPHARPPLPGQAAGGQTGSGAGVAAPLLVPFAKAAAVGQQDSGLCSYVGLALDVAVEMPAPGCLHLVLQSLGGEPQHCLINATRTPLSYRQASPSAAWQTLAPLSGAALVLLQPGGPAKPAGDGVSVTGCGEVELRDVDPSTSGSAMCSLDSDSSGMSIAQGTSSGGGSGGGSGAAPSVAQRGARELPTTFPVAGGAMQALVQVLPVLEAVMLQAGPAEVPGAGTVSLGRTQTDRLLRILPKPPTVSMNQLRLAACIAGQDQVCAQCNCSRV